VDLTVWTGTQSMHGKGLPVHRASEKDNIREHSRTGPPMRRQSAESDKEGVDVQREGREWTHSHTCTSKQKFCLKQHALGEVASQVEGVWEQRCMRLD
jgi:hypothetical protein